MRVVRHLSAKHRACTKCACLKNVAMITHPSLHNRNDHPHPSLHSRYHHPSHPLQKLRSCPTRKHSCREHPADVYMCLSNGSSSKQSRARIPEAHGSAGVIDVRQPPRISILARGRAIGRGSQTQPPLPKLRHCDDRCGCAARGLSGRGVC